MDATFIKSIYHERQEAGSMLCAQHALNNLVQAPMFTVQDLAGIAQELDRLEAAQLDDGTFGRSHNFDDTGYFSVMVIEEALKVLGLRLVRWKSSEMRAVHDKPESMEGFILNHQLHWYTIRRFALAERFYNLDSCIEKPQWISPMYLGLTLREAEIQGYSIFVVVPIEESNVMGLPPCDAADVAQTLPPPTSRGDAPSATGPSTSGKFTGVGQSLGSADVSALSSSAMIGGATTKGKGKATNLTAPPQPLRQSSKRNIVDGNISSDDDDDVIIVDHSASASSVEEESRHARSRRRRRVGERTLPVADASESPAPVDRNALSEEDQMALAIAESLKASKLGGSDSGERSRREVQSSSTTATNVQPTTGTVTATSGASDVGPASTRKSRGQQEEDAELEAALKASLELAKADNGQEEESDSDGDDDGEDDTPTIEELRQRRLARFGA